MQTARYISKLENNVEQPYETTTSISKLLNRKNLLKISGHANEGTGIYEDIFTDDMALARTVVTFTADNSGRSFYNLDVLVAKYDGSDRDLILELLKQKHLESMASAQANGEEKFSNPLPEVRL